MNEELKKLLEQLNGNVEQLSKGNAVVDAANTRIPAESPAGEIETTGITASKMDDNFVSPMRRGFERLAKSAPSNFGHLGATKILDDPFSYIRAKNADGSYVVKNWELDAIIKGLLASSADDRIGAGATPLDEWKEKSGNSENTIDGAFEEAFARKSFGAFSGEVRKAVDASTGAALIRTDIEPILRETFVRAFPAYEMIPKIPSNGIKHTWTQVTSPGTAALITDLGDFSSTASNQNYGQAQSTNIATVAAQREIGLKVMMASRQSGMNFFGPNGQPEITGALTAMANVIQGQIFQGNFTTAAKSLDDEEGLTNVLGFDGYRQQLMSGSFSINKSSDSYLTALRRAVGQLFDAGANMSEVAVFLSIGAQNALDAELETFYQYAKAEAGSATPTNFSAAGLTLLNGVLARLKAVPSGGGQGNGIGYYTYSAAATEDIYVLDPNGSALPYIGSPGPTILELPTGWGNHLSNTFVPFFMCGLAIYVKGFNRKIRIAKTTI